MRTYTRATSLKLFVTKKKQRKIRALIEAYRFAVNFYLQSFQNERGRLDKDTLARLQVTKLSARYKSNALKQALGIYQSLKNRNKIPKFKGFPVLDKKFIDIQEGENSFDVWLKLSTLSKGKRIFLPTKKHKRLNYWLERGKLIQGCELHENKIIVWIEIEKQNWKQGNKHLGVDLGMKKLLTTSQKEYLGKNIGNLLSKILRKKKNSKAYKKAILERDNYVNCVINKIDWDNIDVLSYENLKNISKGKTGLRKFKKFRVKQQHWVHRKVITRILQKCEENRVRPVYVNPQNTSRMCPICNNVDEANRKLENFHCLACGYEQDADYVGAMNIKSKAIGWLGSLESPNSKSNI